MGNFWMEPCRNASVKKQLRTKTWRLNKRKESGGAKCFLLKPPPVFSPSHLSFFPQKTADRWKRNLQAWPCGFRSVSLFGPHVEEELVLARPRTIIQTERIGCCRDTARANQKGHRSVPLNLTAGEHIPAPI